MAAPEQNDGDDRVDLFVFSNEGSAELFSQLGSGLGDPEPEPDRPYLRLAARLIGGHDLFTAWVLDDTSQVELSLDTLRGGGNALSVDTAVCQVHGPKRVKRTPPCLFESFIRITFPSGTNLTQKLEELSSPSLAGYSGSCLVRGSYHMLLELGANDATTLSERVEAARLVAESGSSVGLPLWDRHDWQPPVGMPTGDCS